MLGFPGTFRLNATGPLSEPFYGTNRPGSKVSQGMRDSFWLWSMQVGLKRASPVPGTCSPQGQAAVTQERVGQVVGVADALDAAFGRCDDVVEGVAGQVG